MDRYSIFISSNILFIIVCIIENTLFLLSFFQVLYLEILLNEHFQYVNGNIESLSKVKQSEKCRIISVSILTRVWSNFRKYHKVIGRKNLQNLFKMSNIKILSNIHHLLCEIGEILNKTYSAQLTFVISISFVQITNSSFVYARLIIFFDIYITKMQSLALFVLILTLLSSLTILSWLCSLLSFEVSEKNNFQSALMKRNERSRK